MTTGLERRPNVHDVSVRLGELFPPPEACVVLGPKPFNLRASRKPVPCSLDGDQPSKTAKATRTPRRLHRLSRTPHRRRLLPSSPPLTVTLKPRPSLRALPPRPRLSPLPKKAPVKRPPPPPPPPLLLVLLLLLLPIRTPPRRQPALQLGSRRRKRVPFTAAMMLPLPWVPT